MNRRFQILVFLPLVPFRQCLGERLGKVFAFDETLSRLRKVIGQKQKADRGSILCSPIFFLCPLFFSTLPP